MTNKKINLDTDFLDEDSKASKKEDFSGFEEIFSQFWWKNKWNSNNTNSSYQTLWDDRNLNESSSNKNTKENYGFRHVFWGLLTIFVIIALSGWLDTNPTSSISSSVSDSSIEDINFTDKDSKKTATNNSPSNSNEDEVITWQFSCSTYNHDEAGRLSPSGFDKAEIDRKLAELNTMDSWIDEIDGEISSFKLNEKSQYSVNTYNKKIDTYNSLINKRKVKYSEYEKLLDSYNASVDKYNSYLENNCTRRY